MITASRLAACPRAGLRSKNTDLGRGEQTPGKAVRVIYDLLGYLVIGLHYSFLLYLVVGGFIAWRWSRTIALHVLAAAWGVLIVAAHLLCPLTWAQNRLRTLAGRPALHDSFLNLYVRGVFYPAHAEHATQAVVALVVLASWAGLWWRHAHRHATSEQDAAVPATRSVTS